MRRRYEGSCHCGEIRFAFTSEEITTGKRCDCSICIRKGAVVSSTYIPAEDFEPHRDMSLLTDYRWNDRCVNHLFCKRCGIYPYHGDDEYGYRVNLGCIDDLDPFRLDVSIIDGRSMPITSPRGE